MAASYPRDQAELVFLTLLLFLIIAIGISGLDWSIGGLDWTGLD
jgi:hypothetical protein